MNDVLVICDGAVFAAAIYLILRGSLTSMVAGFALMTHAVNMLIFAAGILRRGRPPLLDESGTPSGFSDPLPQALILTSIVIGFAMQAYLVVLVRRLHGLWKSDEADPGAAPHVGEDE